MKKLILILSAMVVLLSITACGKNGDASKNITTTTTTSITTTQSENEQPEIEPLPVPEGGWTAEELAKTIRINGELISIPFTIDSLGEGYTYSEEHYSIEYNGDYLAMVTFVEGEEVEERFRKVKNIGTFENVTNNALTINSIALGSRIEEAEDVFGVPTKVNDNAYLYCENGKEESYLVFQYDENKQISRIIFDFE